MMDSCKVDSSRVMHTVYMACTRSTFTAHFVGLVQFWVSRRAKDVWCRLSCSLFVVRCSNQEKKRLHVIIMTTADVVVKNSQYHMTTMYSCMYCAMQTAKKTRMPKIVQKSMHFLVFTFNKIIS